MMLCAPPSRIKQVIGSHQEDSACGPACGNDHFGLFPTGGQRLFAEDCPLARGNCRQDLAAMFTGRTAHGHHVHLHVREQFSFPLRPPGTKLLSQTLGAPASRIGDVHHPEQFRQPSQHRKVKSRDTRPGSKNTYVPRHRCLPSYVFIIHKYGKF
jgi:hypothetical protein